MFLYLLMATTNHMFQENDGVDDEAADRDVKTGIKQDHVDKFLTTIGPDTFFLPDIVHPAGYLCQVSSIRQDSRH